MQMNLLITIKMVELRKAEQLFQELQSLGPLGSSLISGTTWDFPKDMCPGASGIKLTSPKAGVGREQARVLEFRLPVQVWPASLSKTMGPDSNQSSPEDKVEQKGGGLHLWNAQRKGKTDTLRKS